MKALLINRNRLTLAQGMADWLAGQNCEPIFIDNGSDYPPLLEYYQQSPYKVLIMGANYGHTVVWFTNVLEVLGVQADERYIVSDSDLDLRTLPADWLDVLHAGLDKYTKYDKCALGLEINDLPASPEGIYISTRCEARYWKQPLDARYFHADTDTTLALYREGVRAYNHNAIRTNRPYVCRHVPWYYTDFASLPADEQYYFQTANDSSSGKKRLLP